MNIVINAVLANPQPRGVGRYINNLIPELAKLDKENNYYIYYGSWMKRYSFLQTKQDNFRFEELRISNNRFIRNIYLSLLLPLRVEKHKPDLFFLIDTQAILVKPCKIISTIHDLAEFETKEKYSLKHAAIRKAIVRHQVLLSDFIITDSFYSMRDIQKRFDVKDNKLCVIYISTECKNEKPLAPKDYFLFVSETERAKNLMGLIDAYDTLPKELKEKYKISVVGKKGNDYSNIIRKIKEKNIEDKITFYGYLTDDELELLYREAFIFIFPSFFEGFGLPVLEAMSKGTPVICSNAASIPEVGGDAVLTFDPYDTNDLADKIIQICTTEGLREDLIKRGLERASQFTGERFARDTIEAFNKAVLSKNG